MSFHGVEIPFENETDWLDKRREGIGASDVAGILSVSPYSTPFTVWADKVIGVEKDPTEGMRWGQKLENLVADEFEEQTGLYIGNRQMLVHHPEYPWAMATLDGLEYEGPVASGIGDNYRAIPFRSLGNYEGKTETLFGRWDEIPDHYQIQVQWQLYVTGHDGGHIGCLHGGRQFEVYEFERDPGLINMILDRVSEFRGKHLTGGLDGETPPPPEVDGHQATTRVIADLWEPEGESVELEPKSVSDLVSLRLIKAELKRLEDAKKELENRVKASLAEAETGLVDGVPVVTWRKFHRKEYTVKAGDYRRLNLIKEKE